MTEAKTQKTQPAAQTGKKSTAGKDAELSDAALNKVSGGNMPTSVEMPASAQHGAGGAGRG